MMNEHDKSLIAVIYNNIRRIRLLFIAITYCINNLH